MKCFKYNHSYPACMEKTRLFAIHIHQGQYRKKSKDPYSIHPLRVEQLIAKHFRHRNDVDTLRKIGLLHDSIEDTWVTKNVLAQKYDEDVVNGVVALTKKKDESIQKYMAKVNKNEQACIVKACDMLDNIRDVGDDKTFKKKLQKKYQQCITLLHCEEKGFLNIKQYLLQELRSS